MLGRYTSLLVFCNNTSRCAVEKAAAAQYQRFFFMTILSYIVQGKRGALVFAGKGLIAFKRRTLELKTMNKRNPPTLYFLDHSNTEGAHSPSNRESDSPVRLCMPRLAVYCTLYPSNLKRHHRIGPIRSLTTIPIFRKKKNLKSSAGLFFIYLLYLWRELFWENIRAKRCPLTLWCRYQRGFNNLFFVLFFSWDESWEVLEKKRNTVRTPAETTKFLFFFFFLLVGCR